jgi:ECF transporter S component (folate family)
VKFDLKTKNNIKSSQINIITICGLLLAIQLIIERFRLIIPIGGYPSIKISFGRAIYKFIAIKFGAFYGGIVPALGDLINAFTNPIGNYIWILTISEFMKGYLTGHLWTLTKKIGINNLLLNLIIAILPVSLFFCLVNTFVLKLYGYIPNKIFVFTLIMRLIEEIAMSTYNIIILLIMLHLFKKYYKFR